MKLASFFLALLLLFQGTYWNMDDISRMGVLIEHAKLHSDAYGDNFWVFLSKHYGELQKEHDSNDHTGQSQHEDLPFQSNSCVLILANLTCLSANYTLTNTLANNTAPQNFHYQDNYASLDCFDIFEPPRLT